jgi:hypothetical protein
MLPRRHLVFCFSVGIRTTYERQRLELLDRRWVLDLLRDCLRFVSRVLDRTELVQHGARWTPRDTTQGDLFDTGWLELSHEFYQTIINSPVPVDIRALKALNHSPLALDLYAWATYKAYSTSLKNRSQFFSYKDLQQQLGAQYSELKAFGRKFRSALALVRTVYPGLDVRIETGGVCICPSQPAVPKRLTG